MKKLQSKAFTLIELLVVIAIISLLVSILLPSLNRAKDLARCVVCAGNMRNLGLSFVMYQQEWEGWFPLVREVGADPLTGVWADKLYNDYSQDVNAFCCPSAPADRIFTPNEDLGAEYMAYGMEWWLGGGMSIGAPTGQIGSTHKINDVSQTSETVLLGESSKGHGYGVLSDKESQGASAPWGWPDDTRHSGASNILLVDNHVGSYTQDEAFSGELFWYGPDD